MKQPSILKNYKMATSNRRQFLQTSALLCAGTVLVPSFSFSKYQPKLSFSTLGCPDWSLKQFTDFATANGYKGIELRGIQREMDLTKAKDLSTPEARKETMKIMEDKGLQFVDLGSSATMHITDPAERQKSMDEGKRFIDLAQQLNCPNVRVFPNNLPKDESQKAAVLETIINGILQLADHAKGSKVNVVVESHGDLIHITDLEYVMRATKHPNTGMIWDVCNMFAITKEDPLDAYHKLKPYIKHTHIKNAKLLDDKIQYVLLNEGDVPIFKAIDALAGGGYHGYFSFEWEKLWHPEIEEPEIALADYPNAMRTHFEKM